MANKDTKKTMSIIGVPTAWVLFMKDNGAFADPSGDTDAGFRFKLEYLESRPVLKVTFSESASSETIEIAGCDDSVISFPSVKRTLSGTEVDGNSNPKDITEASDSTTGHEMTLVVNKADRDSVSWSAFLAKLESLKDREALVVIPTGFTRESRSVTKNADGFAYMVGKLDGTFDVGNANITLTFKSVKQTVVDAAWNTMVKALDYSAEPASEEPGYIPYMSVDSFNITPTTFTVDADCEELGNGGVVIKAISYS